MPPTKSGAFFIAKNIFEKFFHILGTFRRFYVGVYTEKIAHRSYGAFFFSADTVVHNGVRTIEFPDERDTQRGGYAMTACREARAPEKEV